jgi:hypothetical protein
LASDVLAAGGLERGLDEQQLCPQGLDVEAEVLAVIPIPQHAVGDGGQRLAHHPQPRADERVHPTSAAPD